MKQVKKNQMAAPLAWALFTAPSQRPHYQRVSRLVANATEQQRTDILQKLNAGQPVVFETSGIRLQGKPMSIPEKKRLTHLLNFEQAGFLLSAFHADMALYERNGQNYYSMQEVTERGFMPKPGIDLRPLNIPVFNPQGLLIDVFCPVHQEDSSFYLDAGARKQPLIRKLSTPRNSI